MVRDGVIRGIGRNTYRGGCARWRYVGARWDPASARATSWRRRKTREALRRCGNGPVPRQFGSELVSILEGLALAGIAPEVDLNAATIPLTAPSTRAAPKGGANQLGRSLAQGGR